MYIHAKIEEHFLYAVRASTIATQRPGKTHLQRKKGCVYFVFRAEELLLVRVGAAFKQTGNSITEKKIWL
jgi:hypothetical protein